MIGDRLYTLSERDIQSRWLQPFLFTAFTLQAALNISVDVFPVPAAHALRLLTIVLRATPGSGQIINSFNFQLARSLTDPLISLKEDFLAKAANQTGSLDWQGEVLMVPTMLLRGSGSFNASVNANRVQLYITGLLIPIGNIEQS